MMMSLLFAHTLKKTKQPCRPTKALFGENLPRFPDGLVVIRMLLFVMMWRIEKEHLAVLSHRPGVVLRRVDKEKFREKFVVF
jgi:hypothetical protein